MAAAQFLDSDFAVSIAYLRGLFTRSLRTEKDRGEGRRRAEEYIRSWRYLKGW